MPSLDDYRHQSLYSDPREHAARLEGLPTDLADLSAVVRNVFVHYRGSEGAYPPARVPEVDLRWIDRILATDHSRCEAPLPVFRPESQRVVGCCRDYTLLSVARLRAAGVPARSRVGFASYFDPAFHHDHVITEFWDGQRWVFADTEVEATETWPGFNPLDFPLGEATFQSAAQVWTRYRAGEIDPDTYGVGADLPIKGGWFIRNYVVQELAHRQRDELLPWDLWGTMSQELDGDLGLIDEVAQLLLAADGGDEAAEQNLTDRYASDARLRPAERVMSASPRGVLDEVDLHARQVVNAP